MKMIAAGAAVPVTKIEVGAYKIPTDSPEADGTYAWDHTTMVTVHAQAGGKVGFGYTYAAAAAGRLIEETLAPVVQGRDALAVPAAWSAMIHAVRNVGRPGVASMAISAVDSALWDLKAKLLNLPLVTLLGAARDAVPVYGSGGFTSYANRRLRDQLAGWAAQGIPRVKMKIGTHPAEDLDRVRAARSAIGDKTELVVDAYGAYSRKEALAFADLFADLGVTWFEEPVSADDLDGLHLVRDRAAAGMDVAAGLEGIDHLLLEYYRRKGEEAADMKLLPDGKGFMLVEFGGDSKEDADGQARRCMEMLKKKPHPPSMRLYDDKEEEEKLWKVRESALGATAFVPNKPDTWPGWEDSAAPPEQVGDYLRDLRKLFDKYGYDPSLYGHLGQGRIHCRVDFDLYTAEGVRQWRSFLNEAAVLVVRHGGSLSGEYGDGQARAELLPRMFGEEVVQAFRDFKSIWDPEWKMNPGKVVDPYPIASNLRLGTDYNPPQPPTHFQYPHDRGAFSRAALRCVGVGKCRNHGGQTMCPGYMVTREEKDSTRGRARLLWEMLNGEVLTDGWKSEAVKDALDLCLACKGCKNDCPVNVDMATYKAEFLSHYYEGRLRSRHAYAMGWINRWAELASLAPDLANFFGQTPGLSAIAKWVGGIDQRRRMPAFARQTFKEWFRRRTPRNQDAPPVVLWPDTFNNYLTPEAAKAAVEVLEAAGRQVWAPRANLCCGRPLYDFGVLDQAKAYLRDILQTLRPQIQAGVPVVGLEPSCVAVFRDELNGLFPHDKDALRLSKQTFLLSEFLNREVEDYRPPRLERKALVHFHCHHKSVLGKKDEEELLEKMGLDYSAPEDGCCGMAGSIGFEAGHGHYDVSVACGERVLLPAVRKEDRRTLIIADGFSCKQQIEQTTNRKAMHVAEVLRMALHGGRQEAVSDGLGRFAPTAVWGLGAVGVGLVARDLMRRSAR